MALRIQKKKFTAGLASLMMLGALVYPTVTAIYGSVAKAAALPALVINEFSAFSTDEWVELYNTTGSPVDVTGWTISDSATTIATLSGTVNSHGFKVVAIADNKLQSNDAVKLFNTNKQLVDEIDYTKNLDLYPPEGKSTARIGDGADTWVVRAPSKNASNGDVRPPEVPTGGAPSGKEFLKTKSFTFTWNPSKDPDGNPVTYDFQASRSAATENGVLVDIQKTAMGLTTPQLPGEGVDGEKWFWQVRAKDQAGNTSAWSEDWAFSIDIIEPTVPSITSPVEGQRFNTNTIRAEWTKSIDYLGHNAKTYEIEYDFVNAKGKRVQEYRTTKNLYRDQALGGGVQGDFTIRVRAIDTFGNASEWSAPVTYVYDSKAPSVPRNGRPNNATIQEVELSWDVSKDNIDAVVAYDVQLSRDSKQNDDGSLANPEINIVGTALPPSQLALSEGTWYWVVKAKDATENASAWSEMWNFAVDTSSPSFSLKQTNTNVPVAGDDIFLEGTVKDPVGIESLLLYYNGLSVDITDSVQADGTWSHTIVGGFPSKGSYLVRLVATDTLGNTTTEERSLQNAVTVKVAAFIPNAGGEISRDVIAPLVRPFPAISTPSPNLAVVAPSIVDEEEGGEETGVLGTEMTKDLSVESIAETPAVAASPNGWQFFGIAWYWWLLVAAAIASLIWWLRTVRRARAEELV